MSKARDDVLFPFTPPPFLTNYLHKAQHHRSRVLKWTYQRDYYCGGFGAMTATLFTHQLDLLKVRFQLQGELKPAATYKVKYTNIAQAARDIFVHDGVLGFYKGITTALAYQFFMNVIRLFCYEQINRRGLTSDANEEVVLWRQTCAAVISGTVGAVLTSPLYLVKIQTQSQARHGDLAVGWQHGHNKARTALWNAIRGPAGNLSMFQGGASAVLRMSVASSVQLLCFTTIQKPLVKLGFEDSMSNTAAAAVISSIPLIILSNPADVISTRMYNQEANVYYTSLRDCINKIIEREGWAGFYKGAIVNYCRTVPHIILTVVFWHNLKQEGMSLQLQHQDYFDFSLDAKHNDLMNKFHKEDDS